MVLVAGSTGFGDQMHMVAVVVVSYVDVRVNAGRASYLFIFAVPVVHLDDMSHPLVASLLFYGAKQKNRELSHKTWEVAVDNH